jgi:hypothetical protein
MSDSNPALRDTTWHQDVAPRFGEEPTTRRQWERRDDDASVLYEARERFRRVIDWEAEFRSAFVNDVRFCNGDADNHWQWPETMYQDRDQQERPSLTVNKTRQHCLQIVNDAKQNKPEVRVSPVSDEATKASADVFEGVIRHIEYVSNAATAYDTATEHQVQGGIGWWRVITDYEGPDSFEVGCRIQRVRDALSVYMDPDIQQADGSDARFAFVVDDVPRDQFETKYPEYVNRIPQGNFGPFVAGGWLSEDHVRVAEYYRRTEEMDVLHLLPDGSTVRESELENEVSVRQARAVSLRRREVEGERIEWYKIVGGQVVDQALWPGKYIPLVRVVGEETIIDGRLERKGHTRALKDPQRIYNYWSSSAVESVALQSKTPYVAAAESIEAFQTYWDSANTTNHSVLPYNARDDQGQPLPVPQRQEPPQMPQAYVLGMQIAQNEMMLVTGQYQPTMGQPSPQMETSGRAIALRQRQGDNATYHYIDNLAIAIRFTGRILIDLIPKIYDTERVLRIMAPDGTVDRVQLNPRQPQALMELPNPNPNQAQNAPGMLPPTPQQALAASVTRIFNPAVGKYEVQADIGPAYATKRQQAFDALMQVMATAPQVMSVAGDLLMKNADFPYAEDLAERLQRLVPPQALGTGPSPAEQQMQQQLQGAQAHVALLSERLAVAEMKLKGRDEQKDIDAYEAVTKRMDTLLSMKGTDSPYGDAVEIRGLIMHMVQDALKQSGMAPVSNAAMGEIHQMRQQNAMTAPGPPMPGNGQGMPIVPGPLASGQMASLSPVRPPLQRPPGGAPFRGVTGPGG